MVRRPRPSASEPTGEPRLRGSTEDARRALEERIKVGEELVTRVATVWSFEDLEEQVSRPSRRWTDYNEDLIRSLFENSDRLVTEYKGSWYFASTLDTVDERRRDLVERVNDRLDRLHSLIDRLPLLSSAVPGSPTPASVTDKPLVVFVVHGHDDAARLEVCRFLEATSENFDVTVLSETENEGRTIIEKVEREGSRATHAVVILTGDDQGAEKGAAALRSRARQNVILELGYFIGKLGRAAVAILYEPGVEWPSDAQGIAYIELDQGGGWKLKLMKELVGQGHRLDINRAPV